MEKPSELFNRRHTKQQSFDAIRAEIDGDHRIRALVLRFWKSEMLNPLLPSNELAGADFVRSFGLARRVVTLPDLPEGLPEPYDDRDEPYEPYEDEPECNPPEKRRLPEP